MGVKNFLAQHRAGYRTLRELIEDIAQQNDCTCEEAAVALGRLINRHAVRAYQISTLEVTPYDWCVGRIVAASGETHEGLGFGVYEHLDNSDRIVQEEPLDDVFPF